VRRPKLRELLQTQGEAARLSRRLVALEEGLELPFDLDHLRYGGWNEAVLLAMFRRFGFKRLVDELTPRPPAPSPVQRPAQVEPAPARQGPVQTIVVRKAAELATVVELCRAAGLFAIEPHPEGRAIVGADLVGVALAWAPGEAAYVSLVRGLFDGVGAPTADAVREAIAPLLADARTPKLVHDLTRTALLLGEWGLGARSGVTFDTMLGSYLVDPERHAHRLEQIAATTLQTTLPDYDAAGTGERGKKVALNELVGDEAAPLAGARAAAIVRGAAVLASEVEAAGLTGVLADVELPLAFVLAELERVGIAVDTAELARLSSEATVRLGVLEEEARRAAGVDFNLGSPKQLAEVLFEKLGLPVGRRTKTGYSTDSDVLEELEPLHALPGLVLEHRAIAKLEGTYLDALPRMVHPRTGRLHTTYNQTGSATGRISSNDPNLQNVPVRTGLGQQIRRAFVPAPGHVLLSADYSQIELRVLAHLAEDPILLDAFAKDEDIHDRTAREVFGEAVGEGTVDGELRRRAKAINFGVIYGQTDFGLSKGLGIHKAEAARFIAAYFERYAGIARFLEQTVAEAREKGYCQTLSGRRRFLPDLRSANRTVRLAAERVARNTPIQGTAADILKVAMVQVQAALSREHLKARMLLTVHDELVFEVPRGEEERIAALARRQMSDVLPLRVPLRVDVGWGESWAACKSSGKSPAA
jgi:DNA polymerase-1